MAAAVHKHMKSCQAGGWCAGIVFEARDRKGELRAIAGGGRYDQLLQTFGGQQQPCAGFGFGDAVIMELLKDLNRLPQFEHKVYYHDPLLCQCCSHPGTSSLQSHPCITRTDCPEDPKMVYYCTMHQAA